MTTPPAAPRSDAERHLEESIASYRRALAIKPDYAKAHYNLGNALKDLGRTDEAVACYERAVAESKPSARAGSQSLIANGYNSFSHARTRSTSLKPAER